MSISGKSSVVEAGRGKPLNQFARLAGRSRNDDRERRLAGSRR